MRGAIRKRISANAPPAALRFSVVFRSVRLLRRVPVYGGEQQASAPQTAKKTSVAVSDENGESHGDTFLQNIARLMDEYGVSSLDELMEVMDDDRPKPRRGKDFEM